MRIGLISDIHGNYPALEAVLEALQTHHAVDEIWCAGDIVGSVGFSRECLQRVLEACTECVYGNHDARVRSEHTYVPKWPIHHQEHRVVTESLAETHITSLSQLPDLVTRTTGGTTVSLSHADPTDAPVDGYPASNYPDKRKWPRIAADVDADIVAVGHTHKQATLECSQFGNDVTIVNPGSVGIPFDGRAQYAIIDTDHAIAKTAATEFDVEAVTTRMDDRDIDPNL